MKIRGYITHKLAEKDSDCQDYFRINSERKRVAISDGISQSIFPSEWAQLLVKFYVDNDVKDITDSIQKLQCEWQQYAQNQLKQLEAEGLPTWLLENSLAERQGAGATFCGIEFVDNNKWEGQILGDSCLITVGADNSIIEICKSQEGEFGNHPEYFDSFDDGRGEIKCQDGILESSQKLLMVSDPFAELLYLKKKENKEKLYVEKLLQIQFYDDFLLLVDDWRKNENMHNDDSTLVIIEEDGVSDFSIDNSTTTLENLLQQEHEQTTKH